MPARVLYSGTERLSFSFYMIITTTCTIHVRMWFLSNINNTCKLMMYNVHNNYSGLDSTVKNMVTSLRAVGELQNPAIRDRHWLQLMQATQVHVTCYMY